MSTKKIKTTCCVVGGGPAGLMLGFLLARSGVEVVVLEKHSDFLRDFRGDTVHPSTLELMHELGVLDEFLNLPHEKLTKVGAIIGDEQVNFVDFNYLRTTAKYIVLMPQWDFLDFIAGHAKQYSQFNLMMDTEATRLKVDEGSVVGVFANTKDGEIEIEADLVVGADGRASVLRDSAGLKVKEVGAPMDVLWMRLSKKDSDPDQTLGRINYGAFMVMLNRGDYWQCGYVIPKGRFEEYKSKGLENFRESVSKIAPFTADRVNELKTWDDVKLLTVKVDRLKTWYKEGLLCIGDAAHAMSPVAGVGINLAVQDAVATANILWKPLLDRCCSIDELKKVQERRLYPARMMQRVQVAVQNNVISPALKSTGKLSPPLFTKVFNKVPRARALPANLIGLGFRAEHIKSPDRSKQEIFHS